MSASTSILGSEKKRRFVLDTSALIAMIEAEEGAERVRTVIKKEEVFIPFVAVLELRYITLREQGQAEADTRYALLKQIGTQILWQIDEPTLLIAARLKATHRLSLGDSLIAAYSTLR